ncbi:MAG: hypothetical protein Fur0010_09370 [Bdellovibrio sp.]
MNQFLVDQRIQDEAQVILETEHEVVLLVRDVDLPWVILVPKIQDAVEIFDLPDLIKQRLYQNIEVISKFLKIEFNLDKINIGAIGNVVRQLHIHIVGRKFDDRIFPKPPWGNRLDIDAGDPQFYKRFEQCQKIAQLLVQ